MPSPSDADPGRAVDRPAAAATQPEVLDLDALVERCMGNIDFVQRILAKFQQRFPEDLAELERVLEIEDSGEVARVAHRIKGASATVSADGLQHAAAEIERLGREGRTADVPAGIEQLRRQWDRYLDHSASRSLTADISASNKAPTREAATSAAE